MRRWYQVSCVGRGSMFAIRRYLSDNQPIIRL